MSKSPTNWQTICFGARIFGSHFFRCGHPKIKPHISKSSVLCLKLIFSCSTRSTFFEVNLWIFWFPRPMAQIRDGQLEWRSEDKFLPSCFPWDQFWFSKKRVHRKEDILEHTYKTKTMQNKLDSFEASSTPPSQKVKKRQTKFLSKKRNKNKMEKFQNQTGCAAGAVGRFCAGSGSDVAVDATCVPLQPPQSLFITRSERISDFWMHE